MKNLKLFAIVLAIMVSGKTFASKEKPGNEKKSYSYELRNMLQDKFLELDQDYLCKVIFSVNEDKEIVLHAILSHEEFARDYINKKMKDQVLTGAQWEVGKVYHLPVKLKRHN